MNISISGGILDFKITDDNGKEIVQKYNISLTPILETNVPPVITPPIIIPEVPKGLTKQQITTEVLTSKYAWNKDKNRSMKIAFKQLLPVGYTKESKWPLIIDLHGDGPKGSHATEDYKNIDALFKSENSLTGKMLNGKQVKAIVISPLLGWEFGGFTAIPTKDGEKMLPDALISEFRDYAIANLNADPNRIHLVGLSKGAFGAAEAMHHAPYKYASVILFSGTQDVNARLIKSAVRVVKGDKDTKGGGKPEVDVEFIKNMKANKLSPDAEFSIVKAGHDTWIKGTDTENQYKAADLANGFPGNYVLEVDLIEWALQYGYKDGKVVKLK